MWTCLAFMKNCKRGRTALEAAVTAVLQKLFSPFRASPSFHGISLSIQGLDDETHPRSDVPLCHGHHDDSRPTIDPRALAFCGKRELEMLHQGGDDDQHFQDAIRQKGRVSGLSIPRCSGLLTRIANQCILEVHKLYTPQMRMR